MDTTVVDIGSDRLYAVDISHPDGSSARFSRKSRAIKDYELADIPPGQTVRSVALLTSMATALSGLRFDDVSAATVNVLPDSGRTTAVYRAVDGLEIELATATIDGAPWSAVRARYNPEAVLADDTAVPPTATESAAPAQDEPAEQPSAAQVQAEVDAINARVGGWVYRLPDFKISMATKKFADLLKPAESPSATSQANPQATP
jgi:hypothetical protein